MSMSSITIHGFEAGWSSLFLIYPGTYQPGSNIMSWMFNAPQESIALGAY
ncbi:hypothetical protein ACT29H_05775 [Thermophagus sp. OGC60D27]